MANGSSKAFSFYSPIYEITVSPCQFSIFSLKSVKMTCDDGGERTTQQRVPQLKDSDCRVRTYILPVRTWVLTLELLI